MEMTNIPSAEVNTLKKTEISKIHTINKNQHTINETGFILHKT
jgi:hypothetical protein